MPGRGHRWYGAWCCRLLVLAGGLLMAACTSIKPIHNEYCPLPKDASYAAPIDAAQKAATAAASTPHARGCDDLIQVSTAQITINGKAKAIESRQDRNEILGQSLDATTFVLGAAFALKATHGTRISNGAKNLAFGAGAAYVGGNLFAPSAANTIYATADMALVCLSNQSYALMSLYDSAVKNRDNATHMAVDSHCPADADLQQSIGLANAAIARLQSSDAAIAGKLYSTANAAISAAAQGINNLQAPDAFLRAGTGIAVVAGDLEAGQGGAKDLKRVVGGGAPAPPPPTQCQADIALAKAWADAATQAITTAFNSLDNSIQACVTQTQPPPVPLVADPVSLTITPGETRVVIVRGGVPPYTEEWADTPPDAKSVSASVEVVGVGIVSIKVEKTSTVVGTFKLTIKDKSTIPISKDVSVELKAK